jgi:hypothetical protein
MQKFFLLTRKHKDPPLKATGSLWEEENENSNMTLWHLEHFASTIELVDQVFYSRLQRISHWWVL